MQPDKPELMRLQLAEALRAYTAAKPADVPRAGWARAIREALGMTQGQLAQRLKISRQSVQDLEKAEAERRITLDSLDRLAQGLGCRVVYALVPQAGSLDEVRVQRAKVLADALLKPGEHSMKLEAQGLTGPQSERQRMMLVDALLRGSSRKLWE